MRLQDGIYHAPGRRPGRFWGIAFLCVREDAGRAAVHASLTGLWSMWQGLREGRVGDLPGTSVPGGELTVLLGLGPEAFEVPKAKVRDKPQAFASGTFRSPQRSGGGPVLGRSNMLSYADDVRVNLADTELAVQFVADSKLAVDRAIVETWKWLSDDREPESDGNALELATFYLGFQRDDHRSWIDFHDGISNLRSDQREQAIAIDGSGAVAGEEWLRNGTYLAFLRIEVDLASWRPLGRAKQELLVGRDKLTGCPLVAGDGEGEVVPRDGCPVAGGAPIWDTASDGIAEPPAVGEGPLRLSHVQRANQHQGDASSASSLRIFRQGYEFLEWRESAPGFRLGLNFVSFQDTPERLMRMLSQTGWLGDVNFGGDPGDQPRGLDRMLRVYGAGVYVVPPLVEAEPYPGASVFAGVAEPAARADGAAPAGAQA